MGCPDTALTVARNRLIDNLVRFNESGLGIKLHTSHSESEAWIVEQQNLHKAVACHTLSLPLLFTEVLVLQVLRTNPSEVY